VNPASVGLPGASAKVELAGGGPVDVEAVHLVAAAARVLDERVRSAGRRRRRAVEVGRQVGVLQLAARDPRRDEARRGAGQHRRPVERERLRAQVALSLSVEHVGAHVVRVRPHPELRVVDEVLSEVEPVAVVGAARVAGTRDGDALVGDDARGVVAGELRDDPAVGQLVVEHYRVAVPVELAQAAEPAPQRPDVDRPEDGCAGRLVEDLEALVDDLDVLRQPNLAVRVGWSALAVDAGIGDSVEVEERRGHPRPDALGLPCAVPGGAVRQARPASRERLPPGGVPERNGRDLPESR
jgi:hypothetical protein